MSDEINTTNDCLVGAQPFPGAGGPSVVVDETNIVRFFSDSESYGGDLIPCSVCGAKARVVAYRVDRSVVGFCWDDTPDELMPS